MDILEGLLGVVEASTAQSGWRLWIEVLSNNIEIDRARPSQTACVFVLGGDEVKVVRRWKTASESIWEALRP